MSLKYQNQTKTPVKVVDLPTLIKMTHVDEKTILMSKLRQTIARRLKEAQNTAAILTTFNVVDMSAIMSLRKRTNKLKKTWCETWHMSFC